MEYLFIILKAFNKFPVSAFTPLTSNQAFQYSLTQLSQKLGVVRSGNKQARHFKLDIVHFTEFG